MGARGRGIVEGPAAIVYMEEEGRVSAAAMGLLGTTQTANDRGQKAGHSWNANEGVWVCPVGPSTAALTAQDFVGVCGCCAESSDPAWVTTSFESVSSVLC